MTPDDEVTQKVEWRNRVMAAVLRRQFDDETLFEMLDAGWEQAHSEGVLDAAHICQRVAEGAEDSRGKYVAQTLANACLEYDARNKAGRTPAFLE